ncbi:MAG: potassium/proton antiporter [Acidobacteria bacterium]|jgi:cell volume regulation protein A|nr:potassium/proton antiporter [Acidobacteriota bacterium]
MEATNQLIFFCGLLLCAAIFASFVSRRIGAPLLVTFLVVGILFGEDGPGGIVFNDVPLSYLACSFALAIILYDGGIHTPMANFRQALRPAVILASIGVLVTTSVVALGMWAILGTDPLYALLLGSLVASTDAAAVFLLLRQQGIKLKPAVSNTLEVESGVNDPMAIFLALTFTGLILSGGTGEAMDAAWTVPAGFVQQFGIGALLGVAGGRLLTFIYDRIQLELGLNPIFALASGLLIFGAANILGGSGFLAVYLAGLILGNHAYRAKQVVKQFMDGIAWLAQLAMLLILGLLVTPSHLVADIPEALLISAILIFVARPAAVFISLAFEKFTWREKVFISWVGLRGAIPIYLAIIPVLLGVPGNFFNIAFLVVLVSLVLQSTTVGLLSRWLGIGEAPEPAVPEVPAQA